MRRELAATAVTQKGVSVALAAETRGIAIQHIQPGKPQQNDYFERYNRTVGHEWLDQYMFATIKEVQDYATEWLWTYNNDRPTWGLAGSHSLRN